MSKFDYLLAGIWMTSAPLLLAVYATVVEIIHGHMSIICWLPRRCWVKFYSWCKYVLGYLTRNVLTKSLIKSDTSTLNYSRTQDKCLYEVPDIDQN